MLSLIVAMDRNRLIGDRNRLPWHLPADLKYFKAVTMGKPIIMGRKTHESIGRPLPGRRNIVISRDPDFSAPGCETAAGVDDAIAMTAGEPEAVIIGGSQVFRVALPAVQRMYLTFIDAAFDGDTWFPDYDADDWVEREREMHRHADDGGEFTYHFITLERRD